MSEKKPLQPGEIDALVAIILAAAGIARDAIEIARPIAPQLQALRDRLASFPAEPTDLVVDADAIIDDAVGDVGLIVGQAHARADQSLELVRLRRLAETPHQGSLGCRLRAVRGARSQRALASEMRIALRTYQSYERDERIPRAHDLRTLSTIGVDLNWLITGRRVMP